MMTDVARTEERLDLDLRALRAQLERLAELVFSRLTQALSTLARRDRRLGYEVLFGDRGVATLERQVDRLCQNLLLRSRPTGAKLRFVIATAKVTAELERIGSSAQAIARRAISLRTTAEPPDASQLLEISDHVLQALHRAVDAFLERDADAAPSTAELQKARDLGALLRRQLVARGSDPSTCAATLDALNHLELVAGQALKIAREAVYVARGQVVRYEPRHELRVLFVSRRDACRSQMAWATACARATAHFSFASAGTEPGALDADTVHFMAALGVDLSDRKPQGVRDLGNLGDYDAVVVLAHEAESAPLSVVADTVVLTWDIADPSLSPGGPQERAAAYDRVYGELDARIVELLDSLVSARAEPEGS